MVEEKKNIPKVRFREFAGDDANAWELRKLGDIGSVAMNKRVFKHQTSDNGEIPFFKIGTFGGKADTFISRKLFEEYKRKYPYPNKGDILLSASGSIGKIVVYTGEDEYFQDSNIVWFKHDGKINNQFLKQFYTIVKWDGLEGSTIKRLYNKNILNTNILLPAIREQEKIGTFFKHLDSLITLHQRELDNYKMLKKTMLSKMFPKNDEKYPEIRFTGFAYAWEQRKLREVANHRGGTAIEKYFDKNGQYKVISIGSYGLDGKYIDQNIRAISNKITDERVVHAGELTMVLNDKTANGTIIGRSLLIEQDNKYVVNQRTEIIAPKVIFDSKFAFTILNGSFREKVKRIIQGGTQIYVNYSAVENLSIELPDIEEQQKIGDFFKHLDELITLHQRELESLKTLKKNLLQQMFV